MRCAGGGHAGTEGDRLHSTCSSDERHGSPQGSAGEPGDFQQYVRDFTIGDALGAPPPPGLYFENTNLYVPGASGRGQVGAYKANALLDSPTVNWSTGYNFLGASVAAAIAQPFYEAGVWSNSAAGPPYGGATLYPTVHNTWANPFTLSWSLGAGLFASAAFDFYVPDGSRYDGTANPDYWTFEPRASISYLANDWDLSATFLYDISTASAGHTGPFAGTPASVFGVGYRSGDQAFLDVTATKKFGKWEIGRSDISPGRRPRTAPVAAFRARQWEPPPQDCLLAAGPLITRLVL
jgi:hypothetical protein